MLCDQGDPTGPRDMHLQGCTSQLPFQCRDPSPFPFCTQAAGASRGLCRRARAHASQQHSMEQMSQSLFPTILMGLAHRGIAT